MIVFQINVVLNTGSTGRIVEGINTTIQNYGWDSYCYFGRGSNNGSSSKWFGPNKQIDVYSHVSTSRIFDMHGLGSKSETLKLISIIEEVNPDIIHLHNIHGYYLNYPLLFAFLTKYGKPIVWTLHDCWPFTGHCAYFDLVKCDRWKSECYKCPNKKKYPKSLIFDRSKHNYLLKKEIFNLPNNLTLVPVSYWLQNTLKESFLSNHNIQTIHNGLDLSVFNIRHSILSGRKIVLGVASIWDARKGLRDFIELANLLDDSYLIVLIGLNKRQLEGLPKNIKGIPRTESIEELAKYYSDATVFINPTYEDNFPTTNLEALACGTPVITYNTGGSPEAIDSDTGFVVEKGDIKALAEKIEVVKRNGKNHYQHLCRARAKDFYNKEDRYQDYIDLYKRLIENNK